MQRHDTLINVPDCIPSRQYGLLGKISKNVLGLCGWKIVGELPTEKKFVLAIAPHTSNWDFFVGIAAMFSLNLKLTFLGKASIFRWPFKSILEAIGGLAVERSHRHGVVGQIVNEFERNDAFVLALAPEGTRSKTKEWKTGFLQIAHKANVCVVPASFDFSKKEIRFYSAVDISNNIEQELVMFKAIFDDVCAKKPQAV